MTTLEERVTVLEQTAVSRIDYINGVNRLMLQMAQNASDTSHELTILLGVTGSQGQDIKILKEDVKALKEDVATLQGDVSVLKEDVSVLKRDVATLQRDVSVLKEDVSVLKRDVATLQGDVSVLKRDVATLQGDVSDIKKQLEGVDQRLDRLETRANEHTTLLMQILTRLPEKS